MMLPWKKAKPAYPKQFSALRIVTFNVHFAPDPFALVSSILHNPHLREADVFMLQEIEFHEREMMSRTEAVARMLGFHHAYAPARALARPGSHGLAIISKYELRDVEVVRLPFYRLLGRSRSRIALLGRLQIGAQAIVLCNVHLDTTLSTPRRIEQLGYVVQKLLKIPYGKIILGGDFNTIPLSVVGNKLPVFYSNQKKKLKAYLELQGFQTSTQRVGYTLGRGLVGFQLDGIYTKNLEITQSGVERSVTVSDHKPLWVDVTLGSGLPA